MLYQSLGQFGREGKRAWYDLAVWRACAAVKDPDTAKEPSEVCGSYDVIQTS
jgi:type IV secretion system protein VirD4